MLVLIQAHLLGWPKDTRPSWRFLLQSLRDAAVPLVIPLVILGGFYLGAFTATEAGAIVALYSLLAARLYYRNCPGGRSASIAYDSAVLTAAVVFLLAVATIFQYLMGVTGVPVLLGELLKPLEIAHWLFLLGVALITMLFGMVLEGLAGGGRADPGGVSDRHPDRHQPDPFRHRADRRGRHRPVPAADGGRAADGAALCRGLGRSTPAPTGPMCWRC